MQATMRRMPSSAQLYAAAASAPRPSSPLRLFAAEQPGESRLAMLAYGAMFFGWAVIVLVGIHFHEFWRDEVRALSIAVGAPGLSSLFAQLHGEGHPSLWYLLLRGAYAVYGTKAVLPAVSAVVAAGAVALFLWR